MKGIADIFVILFSTMFFTAFFSFLIYVLHYGTATHIETVGKDIADMHMLLITHIIRNCISTAGISDDVILDALTYYGKDFIRSCGISIPSIRIKIGNYEYTTIKTILGKRSFKGERKSKIWIRRYKDRKKMGKFATLDGCYILSTLEANVMKKKCKIIMLRKIENGKCNNENNEIDITKLKNGDIYTINIYRKKVYELFGDVAENYEDCFERNKILLYSYTNTEINNANMVVTFYEKRIEE